MILKLAPNLPLKLAVKYIDAVPPNDPKYGPQARIKTNSDDVLYLPGKATDAFTELFQHGVITAMPTTLPTAPGEQLIGVPIRPGVKEITVTLEQGAGEKHGKVRIVGANGAPTPAQKNVTAAPADYYPLQHETGAPPANVAPAGAQAHATAPRMTYSNARYLQIIEFVTDEVVPRVQNGAGLRMTPESIVAAAATLYIAEGRRGTR